MAQLIQAALDRVWLSVRTWPTSRQWTWAATLAISILAAAGVVGFSTGLYQFHNGDLAALPGRMLLVLFIPALGEELFFRGLLMPGRDETDRPWKPLLLSSGIYTLWHVFEALTFLPAAKATFLRPDFLIVCFILGLGCGMLRWRTGSLWPAVALHWALVVVWQTWLGGLSAIG